MSQTSLIALIADARTERIPAGYRTRQEGRLAAVFGSASRLGPLTRKAALRAALTRQQALEALMPAGTVLPALPGTMLDPRETGAMVQANAPLFEDLAERFAGRVQYQLCILWDPEAAATHFLGARAPLGPQDDLHTVAETLADHARAALDTIVVERCDLPLRDGVAFNAALLVDTARNGDLDVALEQIDALWSVGLTLRLIGPSPAVSFASLGLHRLGKAHLRAAARLLDLQDEGQIEAARRRALMAGQHPPEAIRQAARNLARAQALGRPEGPLHVAYVWSEGRAETTGHLDLQGAA